MQQAVEWSYDPADFRWRRVATYCSIGLFGGFVAVMLTGGLLLVVQQALAGEYTIPLLVLVLALVGGPFSLLYLWPLLNNLEQRPPLIETEWRPAPHWMVLSLALGAAGIGGLVVFFPSWLLLVVLFVFPLFFITSQFNADGRIDPAEDSICLYNRTGRLSAVESFRRFDVGPGSVLYVQYESRSVRGPRVFTVPRTIADEAADAVAWGVAQDSGIEAATDGLGRTPLMVAAGCCLLVAGGLGYAGSRYAGSLAVVAPGIGLFAVIGLLFGWLAWNN